MTAPRKREAKPRVGRPVEPDSLRQTGVGLHLRVPREEKERWDKRAEKEGRALAEIIRTLLNAWEQGKRG